MLKKLSQQYQKISMKSLQLGISLNYSTNKIRYSFRSTRFIVKSQEQNESSKIMMITKEEIISFLKNNKIAYRIQRTYAQLQFCPFCIKRNFDELSNQYTMGINLKNGMYNCFRSSCQSKGQWKDFLQQMTNNDPKLIVDGPIHSIPKQNNQEEVGIYDQKYELFQFHLHYQRMKLQQPKFIYEYLVGNNWDKNQRGIKEEVLNKYLVGIGQDEVFDPQLKQMVMAPLIYFPMFRLLSQQQQNDNDIKNEYIQSKYNSQLYELVSCKLRGMGKENKYIQKIEPKNAMKGIFGLNLLTKNVKQIILTEGEFDAMAAYQMTEIPSISLPYGIAHFPNFLLEWINEYKELNNIFIWVDDDEFGRVNSNKIASKIGNWRTRIIQPSLINNNQYPKDANDCLRYYPDKIQEYISKSITVK
ncbi:unnamed protein product [Paramecium primaurelia]|uniref:Toprim domain-containing protein n=1 Tax=Paramecium primaurelia TaxID=5886 RepID=A0A8S1L547_PARPR|nr:unnamed protein product [Paramecium primaurelia]